MCKYVKSIFDTDLYKFTTSYAYMKLYPHASGTFKFTDRNHTKYTPEQFMEVQEAINSLDQVENPIPIQWLLKKVPYIPEYYWEWLIHSFRFEPHKVNVTYNSDTQEIGIEVFDKMHKVTLYEIAILCIMAAIQNKGYQIPDGLVAINTQMKIDYAIQHNIIFSEFGTRRRFSFEVQEEVVKMLKNCPTCTGTSNVYLAYKYDMTPTGTHPHEWFMFHGAQFGYQHANYMALEAWTQVYDGNLGIALTDTYTSDVFFKNFSMKHAKLFDGIRQDSGDEYEFTLKAQKRYQEHKIDLRNKAIIYSNGLNFVKAGEIQEKVKDMCMPRFGIGTNLTNDVGCKAPNIVMKLINCQMTDNSDVQGCIKLSDDLGKHMGDPKDIEAAMHILKIKQ